MPGKISCGSYIKNICKKCGKENKANFTHEISDEFLTIYCKVNRIEFYDK